MSADEVGGGQVGKCGKGIRDVRVDEAEDVIEEVGKMKYRK